MLSSRNLTDINFQCVFILKLLRVTKQDENRVLGMSSATQFRRKQHYRNAAQQKKIFKLFELFPPRRRTFILEGKRLLLRLTTQVHGMCGTCCRPGGAIKQLRKRDDTIWRFTEQLRPIRREVEKRGQIREKCCCIPAIKNKMLHTLKESL